ncbi:MAG: ribosome-associated protein [Oceanicoccus sp.]|jgi:ribosome-associated protein
MSKKERRPPNNSSDESYEEEVEISKTAIKKEMLELQNLGEALVKLSKGELAAIPISDETLAEAIQIARKIKHREGLRRQMQYIGKLMRKTDLSEINSAYEQLQDGRKKETKAFHQLEEWRDQLVEKGAPAVEDVMLKFPDADRQHLRQLISRAAKERDLKKPPACARKLFRYLRELSEA